MKEIPLTKGQIALVDDGDFEWLNQWKWQAKKSGNHYYAYRTIRKDGIRKGLQMHRFILNPLSPKLVVDHINHIGTDNQKMNLRICTQQQNIWNSRKQSMSKNKFKGVKYLKKSNLWIAIIWINKKCIQSKPYKSEVMAAEEYKSMAKKYFGDFACF